MAERVEFELPVPICEQSDNSIRLTFATSRRTAQRYRPGSAFLMRLRFGSPGATGRTLERFRRDGLRVNSNVRYAPAVGMGVPNEGLESTAPQAEQNLAPGRPSAPHAELVNLTLAVRHHQWPESSGDRIQSIAWRVSAKSS